MRRVEPPPDRKPISVLEWLRLPELERKYFAIIFRERHNVEPDPAILRRLEGEG